MFSIEFYFQKGVNKTNPPKGKKMSDLDRRPDDIYNSRHLFGVAVPVNHSTDPWYSSHIVKTNNKKQIFFLMDREVSKSQLRHTEPPRKKQ